jgi:RNA polymerase sigma-70 factor (ECF subfamily)
VEAREDLLQRLEEVYDIELLELAMEHVRLRVEPHTWEAFRLLGLEGLPSEEVAQRLGMKVGMVFVARSRVQKMIRQEIQALEPAEKG